jgi:hypothetical protein
MLVFVLIMTGASTFDGGTDDSNNQNAIERRSHKKGSFCRYRVEKMRYGRSSRNRIVLAETRKKDRWSPKVKTGCRSSRRWRENWLPIVPSMACEVRQSAVRFCGTLGNVMTSM